MSQQRRWRLSRRGFLIGLGVTGAGLALGVTVGLPAVRLRIAETLYESDGGGFGAVEAPPTAWFEISPDNRVRIYIPKVEMGQGVHTALAQIAADELEADWDLVDVHQATTTVGPYDSGGTSGSTSVASLFLPLRKVAATMREMLRTEAARRLGVPPNALTLRDSAAWRTDAPDQRLTYGAIVEGVTAWPEPAGEPQLKPASEFRYIGQPVQRVDFPAKLTGQAVYGYDARLPGMLYGAVARPPTISATMRSAAAGTAQAQPGVVAVVAERDFAGVAAESRAQAYAALAQLDLEWERGREWQQSDIEALITVGQGTGVVIQSEGDAERALANPSLEAEYRTPLAAHAHLEAQAALVDVQPDRVRVWASTQFPDMVRSTVAKELGRRVEEVEVTPTFLGGGFGRKSGLEPAVEAARLSKAAGRPVHIGWSRTEDMRYGYLRPPTHHLLKAQLSGGRIEAIEHQQASGVVAFGFLPGAMAAVMGADFGAWRGAPIAYDAPNMRTVAWRNDLPMRTGWWRGLGLLANTFAVESFVDELAHAAGADPLQFRLDHLPDSERGRRFRAALTRAAERGGWGSAPPAGRARGIACCIDANTVVALVAEVSVEGGRVRVHQVSAAVDPGLVVNPDGARAQTEGGIMMGLSSVLLEEVTVSDGVIDPANFDRYPLLTMKEAPAISVELLDSGDTPYGMGEPPMGPIGAAVANAVFALTGTRLRSLPLKF
ncbi:MAG TPA: molybdopterin cofactor-binding domain-containing protein [Roseiflexaceae bacterium]|nr:molybdopterin cofactor-binding domain-containing protein [Roseiflexaceae bacterium]